MEKMPCHRRCSVIAVSLWCLGGALPVLAAEEGDLTDQERHQSQTYVNEALGNKIVMEECAKLDDPGICRGQRGGKKILGLDPSMISVAAKAYATMMGAGMHKGGLDAKAPEVDETTDLERAAEDGEAKDDYCVLIGTGAEGVGLAMQQLSGKTLQTPVGGATDQKRALYKAARSHRDRAKTAAIQAAGWGGASACYVYMMTSGGAAINSKKNLLKTAASGLLAAFYFREKGLQEKYSDQVKGIADKLPSPGDCNPVTETDCYCSLKEYQNDPKHCVPYLHRKKLSEGSILRVACVNDKLQADPDCQCVGADSCLDKTLKNEFAGSAAGSGFVTVPIGKEVASLVRGELAGGSLTSAALGKNAGLNAFFRKHRDEIPPIGVRGADGASKVSRLGETFGLPGRLAGYVLAAPEPPGMSQAVAKLGGVPVGGGSGTAGAPSKKSSGRILTFQGGGGLREKGKGSPSPSQGFDFQKYLNKGQKKSALKSGEILEFNRRAINSAEVSGNPEKNIFHIISKRYMLWKVRKPLE